MKVLIAAVRHVIVKDDVDSLNVDAAAEYISRDHYALLEVLKLGKSVDALRLWNSRVDANRWERSLV